MEIKCCIQKLPPQLWRHIGLFLPELYRHNLARTCLYLCGHPGVCKGMFYKYKNHMQYSDEFQQINSKRCESLGLARLHFKLIIDINLSKMLTLIENGWNWFQFFELHVIRTFDSYPNFYISFGINMITAVGILRVYSFSQSSIYPDYTTLLLTLQRNAIMLPNSLQHLDDFARALQNYNDDFKNQYKSRAHQYFSQHELAILYQLCFFKYVFQ